MELQPDGKLLRHPSIAVDRQCFARDLMPIRVPEIEPDKDSKVAADGQVDGVSGNFEANVDAGAFENQPHDVQCHSAPGNTEEFEANHHAMLRQRADVYTLAHSPHQ